MALRVGSKRARELPIQRRVEPEPMVVDESGAAAAVLLREEDPGANADREDAAEDDDEEMAIAETYYAFGGDVSMEQPRRKRAMVIRANIQFLQKLPPLANYQRGQFGRRGGVDGGAPDGDLGMLALEETMSDSGFSATPVRAAVVVMPTPVVSSDVVVATANSSSFRYPAYQHRQPHQRHHQIHQHHQHHQIHQLHRNPQVLSARRNATPAFASAPPPPQGLPHFHRLTGPVAWVSARKDDEARPATNDTRLW